MNVYIGVLDCLVVVAYVLQTIFFPRDSDYILKSHVHMGTACGSEGCRGTEQSSTRKYPVTKGISYPGNKFAFHIITSAAEDHFH